MSHQGFEKLFMGIHKRNSALNWNVHIGLTQQIGIQAIGFMQQTKKLEYVSLARSAIASPGGKLSSAARLMRNGETERFSMQFVKKYDLKSCTFLFACVPDQKMSPFLIRPCGAPSPRGKRWCCRTGASHTKLSVLTKADNLNSNLSICPVPPKSIFIFPDCFFFYFAL